MLAADGRRYFRCSRCELTFLQPAQRLDAAAELAQYRLHRNEAEDPGYRAFLARLAEPLLARLSPGSCGLDYGCGPTPVLAQMLRAAGHEVALYDPFFAPQPQLLEARYDFITCTEVAEHFHRPAAEFARFDQLLQGGGWLALMTCFQTDDERFLHWHYRRDPTHVAFYRASTFRWLAQQMGWQIEIPRKDVVLLRKPPLCRRQ